MKKNKRLGIWIPQSILVLELNGTDKILLAEIYSLCEREDGCYASNNHFKKLLGFRTPGAASKRISFLSDKGYIRTEDVFDKGRCIGRRIYRSQKTETVMGVIPNTTEEGIDKMIKDVVQMDDRNIPTGTQLIPVTNSININTDNSIYTGAKSVESTFQNIERPVHIQSGATSMFQFFKKQKEEAAAYLVGATEIGGQIFEFDSPVMFPVLEKLIGTSDFQKVKPVLLRFIDAKSKLG